ncbi:MAG TPA: FecR family protein [Burkholderiales bacterium]|nr:FecR family protein [Burkholderiales bacterium]
MKAVSSLLLAACLALALPYAAAAVPAAVVEGVQMPAWVERDGARAPLAPGMALHSGDRLSTGAGARLLLRLGEGSSVKLGENAGLTLERIGRERDGVFGAALRVLQGAFRFTTAVIAKHRRRDVRITLHTVTAGIRGTDVWGRSTEPKQIVCLIEGRVEVQPQGERAITMDQPLQFYQREHGKSQPLASVSRAQLAKWAAETEIERGAGAALRGGRWQVTLLAADTQAAALAVYDRARAAGYAAEIHPQRAALRWRYEVRIRHLRSKTDAVTLATRLGGDLGVVPRVSK